ncbi:MAG: alcohol dehydrogenase catalytic domain-containing protein, partial [Actinomycetota bacterium]|nr:alcohol dehydrogenase catalytic domain-containing protein [Actinomycetota bacterium]
MRVARFYAPGDIRLEDIPEPTPGPGEVKIKVRACSTCGTDVKISRFGHHHIDPPRVMGHEIAGEVVELGDGVEGWAAGDRVQVIAAIPCGECEFCARGSMTICPNQVSMGYQFEGGFAEYMIVPRNVMKVDGLNRIPDGVSFAEASVAEPFACAINAQNLAHVGKGDVVVVIGSGPIGCLHVRLARARGASKVFLVELSRERLDMAAALVGPDAAIASSEEDAVAKVRELT